MKKWKEIFAGKKAVVLIFAILLVGVCILGFAASSGKSKTETAQAVNTESAVKDEAVDVEDNTAEETVEIEIDPAYQLIWEDEFEGTELNRDDWNVELHDPGWVNAEWQEYVDCEDNIYVGPGLQRSQGHQREGGSLRQGPAVGGTIQGGEWLHHLPGAFGADKTWP